MLHWFKARYRAFQESYDPDEVTAGSGPVLVLMLATALIGTVLMIVYVPGLAQAARLRAAWIPIVFTLLAAASTYTAGRHRCRGPIGTPFTLVDNMWWYFAIVYLAVNTSGAYAIGFALAYSIAVVLVTVQMYGLTLLFGVVLVMPVAVLVPLGRPPASVALILWVAALLSLTVSYITKLRKANTRGARLPAVRADLTEQFADESLQSALITSPPRVIAGKYRLDRIIGSGGVGLVVAAHHLALKQTVALKFLRPVAARYENDAVRFQREAQSAVQLKNEHVCRVFDVGQSEEGLPFIVLECLEGRDLRQVLRSAGPLPIAETVAYLLQACDAVSEAHAIGIIHRDLKPSNLFLTRTHDGLPLVKVLDFGIAKYKSELGEDEVRLTHTRALLGSPVYMSPEQIRNARNVDQRSDIWSLGICLYELLTDHVPFAGDTVTGVAVAITADEVPPITAYRPEIPRALVQVIERCLAKRPEERYQNAAELIQALAAFGQSVSPSGDDLDSASERERAARGAPSQETSGAMDREDLLRERDNERSTHVTAPDPK